MKITRRKAIAGGLAAAAVPVTGMAALAGPPGIRDASETDASFWIQVTEGARVSELGLLGRRACSCANPSLFALTASFSGKPQIRVAQGPSGGSCRGMVVADVDLLLERPGIARQIPEGRPVLLASSEGATLDQKLSAHRLVQGAAAWSAVMDDPLRLFSRDKRTAPFEMASAELFLCLPHIFLRDDLLDTIGSYAKGRLVSAISMYGEDSADRGSRKSIADYLDQMQEEKACAPLALEKLLVDIQFRDCSPKQASEYLAALTPILSSTDLLESLTACSETSPPDPDLGPRFDLLLVKVWGDQV